MKKVLFLAPGHSSFRKPITKTFLHLGWEVKFFDYRKGDLLIRILRFLPIVGGFKKAKEAINKKIVKIARSYDPKLIFVNKGELIPKVVIQEIKSKNNRIINLFPEYLNYWKMARDLSSFYDIFLVFDYPLLKRLNKIGRKNAYYLPFGAEIEKKEDRKKIYDISFIGTWRKSRENTLKKLSEFNLNIWGDSRWYNSSLKQFVKGGRISQQKMKDIIKKSKINLNIYFAGFKLDGAALRVFEVTGCGEFLLSEYKNSISKLYKLGKEVVCYRTIQEMKKKITYFLNNPEEREKIALWGYNRARKNHTWEKRLNKILAMSKSDSIF